MFFEIILLLEKSQKIYEKIYFVKMSFFPKNEFIKKFQKFVWI